MSKDGGHRVVKPVAAAVGIVATMASIWWFALRTAIGHEEEVSASKRLTALA